MGFGQVKSPAQNLRRRHGRTKRGHAKSTSVWLINPVEHQRVSSQLPGHPGGMIILMTPLCTRWFRLQCPYTNTTRGLLKNILQGFSSYSWNDHRGMVSLVMNQRWNICDHCSIRILTDLFICEKGRKEESQWEFPSVKMQQQGIWASCILQVSYVTLG